MQVDENIGIINYYLLHQITLRFLRTVVIDISSECKQGNLRNVVFVVNAIRMLNEMWGVYIA